MRSMRNRKTLNCDLLHFEMRAAVSFTPGLSQVTTERSQGPFVSTAGNVNRGNGRTKKPVKALLQKSNVSVPGAVATGSRGFFE